MPSNWYPDPANPGKARYYNGYSRAWIGKSKTDVDARPIPTEPPVGWSGPADPARLPIAQVTDCRVLGGHGLGIPAGAEVEVDFLPESMRIRPGWASRGSRAAFTPVDVLYADVEEIEIGGPGARTTGGGFMGGGFGIQGAAEGMLIASALNMLTTKTKVDTLVCLRTSSAELFMHHTTETPDALRIRLSQVFNILRARAASTRRGVAGSASENVVEQLARLGDMLDRGLLSREEFEQLKADLLRPELTREPGGA